MTFQTPSGFTQIDTDSGTATITNTKPNLDIVGTGGTTVSASGNVITVDSEARLTLVDSDEFSSVATPEVVLTTTQSEPHLLIIQDYQPSTNATFLSMEASDDGGTTWQTSGYQSSVRYWAWNSTTQNNDTSTTSYTLSGPMRNDTNGSFIIWIGNFNISASLSLNGESIWFDTTLSQSAKGLISGMSPFPPGGYDAIRLFSSSGDMSNGRFRLYSLA